jgi:tetratricopeptide (TPR) repeat protein
MTETTTQPLADQAKKAYEEGDFENAARLFGEAASALWAAGVELDAAEQKNNQAVALLQHGDAAAALEAVRGTSGLFEKAGDTRRAALAIGNEAAALEALGRIADAIEKYQASAKLLEQAGEDQLRASVLQSAAWLYVRQFKFLDALVSMNSGLRGIRNPTLKQKILRFLLTLRI